jgi:small subunit ribosomal protein S6
LAENLYEGMFLLDSSRFSADPDGTSQKIVDLLEKAGATVVANRPWLDGKLAYPINGHRTALHYLTYFKMEGAGGTEITRSCKLSDVVLRHMLIKHPATLFDAMVLSVTGGEVTPTVEEVVAVPADADAKPADADAKPDDADAKPDGSDDDDEVTAATDDV